MRGAPESFSLSWSSFLRQVAPRRLVPTARVEAAEPATPRHACPPNRSRDASCTDTDTRKLRQAEGTWEKWGDSGRRRASADTAETLHGFPNRSSRTVHNFEAKTLMDQNNSFRVHYVKKGRKKEAGRNNLCATTPRYCIQSAPD